jgi:hypothetical protein
LVLSKWGKNARLSREVDRIIAVSILIKKLLASTYLTRYKFIPTHLSKSKTTSYITKPRYHRLIIL